MVIFKKGNKFTMFKKRIVNFKFYNFYKHDFSENWVYGFAMTSGFLEPRIYKKLKRILRKNARRGRSSAEIKNENVSKYKVRFKKMYKCWFYIRPNHTISHKSKNARMGKGKGKFKRWLIRIKGGDLIFKLKGVSYLHIRNKFLKKWNKNFRIRFILSSFSSKTINLKIKKNSPWTAFDAFRFN